MSDLRWYPPSLIDEAALVAATRALPRFGSVRYSVGTDSTQLRALDVLHRLDALGISFVTESQDVGRGRRGRRWMSPPASSLLFSTILPLELRSPALPAVGFWSSLAVADAVASVCGITLELKWPNDLLLGGLKCAGILSEGRSSGALTRVVVGVGLNVNRAAEIPTEISTGVAWLSDAAGRAVDRTALLVQVLRNYEATLDEMLARPTDVIARWSKRSRLGGKRVSVRSVEGAVTHSGAVLDVAPDGSLVLETSDGIVSVTLGDVEVLA